jgi:hypothetical protein
MTSETLNKVRQFVEVREDFLSTLLASRVLRWMIPGTVLRDTVVLHWLYLTAKPCHMEADVDGLACPLYHPTIYNRQTRGQNSLLDATLSHRTAIRVTPFGSMTCSRNDCFDYDLSVVL